MKVASVCSCLPAKAGMTLSSGTPGPGPSRGRGDEVYDMIAEADCRPGHTWAGLLEAKKGND